MIEGCCWSRSRWVVILIHIGSFKCGTNQFQGICVGRACSRLGMVDSCYRYQDPVLVSCGGSHWPFDIFNYVLLCTATSLFVNYRYVFMLLKIFSLVSTVEPYERGVRPCAVFFVQKILSEPYILVENCMFLKQ